jgi:FkbH-like protein
LDVKSHWSSGFPYTLAHASALAELVAQLVHQPGPKKGLITDLDNTLWDGIIGDVGPEEISWDLDHESQGHGLYQQFLHALAQEGILIGVASKNDPKILDEVQNRADLLLPLTQIFPCDVSWGSKAKAVSRILKTWNVHADSVVFVDDNPLELAEVQAMFPEMMCLRFPAGNPNAIYDLLVTLRDLFGKTEISSEDEIRLESIRSSAAWRQATEESTEGFSETLLEQAQAELTVSLKKNPDDSRVLELLNKTNQFNLNGRRFTEAEWQEYLEHSETFVLSVSYKDRFGPLGKVAIITGRPDGVKLSVDSWVMSCRAFARRIEHQCVKFLFDRFKSDLITFDYQETSRNSPVKMFFEQFLSNGLPFPPQISHSEFTARCPKLFHDLRELTDE